MRKTQRAAAALSLAATLNGCISTIPFDARNVTTPVHPRVVMREYTQEGELTLERAVMSEEKQYTVTRVTIPQNEEVPATVVDYYRSRISGPRPLLFMSPPLGTNKPGGKLKVELPFLTYFAKNGWDVALIYRPNIEQTQDPIDDLERGMTLAVNSYRRAVDVLSHTPDVRTDRLCALGISMGGILTTIVVGQEPRIHYSVIALAGSTDKVMANVDDKNPEGFLRKIATIMQQYGGKEQFLAEMDRRVPTQPQRYADNLDPLRTMLIISKRDKIIPRAAAEDLRARAHYPTTRYIHLLGHVASFLLYPVLREEALQFYEKRIAADDATDALAKHKAQANATVPAGGQQ